MALTPEQLSAATRAIQGGYTVAPSAASYAAPSTAYGGLTYEPGTVGPGGAKWGMGSGGPNRFDHTQLYAGLWSIGIDPNSPTVKQDVQRWYDSQPQAVKNEVQKGMGNQPGRGSIDPLVYAVDWRQRDVARKIQKENGFFDTGIGGLLGSVAPFAAAFLPGGQFLAPAVGATIGGVKGGVPGALLGGLGGYMAGQAAPGITNAWNNAGGLSTLMNAPGTFASNIGRGALTSLQNYIPGYGGADAIKQLAGGAAATAVGRGGAAALYGTSGGIGNSSGGAAAIAAPKSSTLLGNVANNMAGNLAMSALGGVLGGEPAAGGVMGNPSPNTWGPNPYNKSPYPELFMRPRRGISNQLVV